MAPIKLEDHIREQFQEREIQTSNNFWEKLQQQIKAAPKKKNNKRWFYLAASIVSVVIISSLILSEQQVITEPSNNIVEVNDSLNEIKPNNNVIVATEEVINNNSSETIDQKEITDSPIKEIALKKNKVIANKKEAIADLNIVMPDSSKINPAKTTLITANNIETDGINEEESFINSKIEEVVAQIKNGSNAISDEEINSLLYKAQQEIYSKKLLRKNKVDASELLSIVEDELEESFRDRVFEALGNGYEKVRTAVVNRNN
jgi:hypothetical protein